MTTKKISLKFEITVENDVDEKTSEFDLGRFTGIVERELVKKIEHINADNRHQENRLNVNVQRIL